MLSFMLVPCLAVSSACPLVRSCSRFIAASPASPGVMRSALTVSSLSEASSGFQWPCPRFCFSMESSLCLAKSEALGSPNFFGMLVTRVCCFGGVMEMEGRKEG
jgi:hypothetical protein